MRLNTFSMLGRIPSQPWTCLKCTNSELRTEARRTYSRSRQARPIRLVRGAKRVNRIYLAVAAVGITGSAYLLRDDLRHWYKAAARTGRVVSTLYLCIQELVHHIEARLRS